MKWRWGLGLAVLGIVACGDGGDDAPPAPPTPADRLEEETGTAWRVDVDPATGTPDMVLALDPIAPSAGNGVSFEHAARAFLEAHAEMWRLADARHELALEEVVVTGDRAGHVRFVQIEGGLRVDGAFLVVHFREDGSLGGIQSVLAPEAREAVDSPALDADAAIAKVDASASAKLLLVPSGAGARLVWRVTTPDLFVDVDAKTGAIVASFGSIANTTATGVGLLGDTKTFEISPINPWVETPYALLRFGNESRTRIETYDYNAGNPQYVITSDANKWEDGVARGKGAAVDAFTYVGFTDRYFRDRHGWSGFDGRGTAIPITVHDTSKAYGKNASYDKGAMHISDYKPYAAALDVMAHEFTHGVTAANSGLRNYGQAGAINEAMSDIFGELVENDNAAPGKNLQLHGSAYVAGGSRDYAHPTQHSPTGEDHMSKLRDDGCDPTDDNDMCSVHANSTIVSNAWWLMTFGGTNDTSKISVKNPLGIDRSRDVWWATEHLLLGPTTRIDHLAQWQTMNAYLYHRPHEPVACAWVATGVLTADYVKNIYGVKCYCPLPDGGVDEACGDARAPPPAGDGGAPPANGASHDEQPELFDSCKGRKDGVYCSELVASSAIVCKDEVIAAGQQCVGGANCTGPNGPGTQIACAGQPAPSPGSQTQPDGCAGRADGVYCSSATTFSAYVCKDGSIAGGQQCATGKSCTGPNGPGDTIACN